MKILDILKSFTADKKSVGIYVSTKSTLEVVYYDNEAKQILKHGSTELQYDPAMRQISNLNLMEVAILKLFEDLDIPTSTPTILSLPTIFIGHQTLPSSLGKDEITMALTSEAEKSYFFRRHEPVISWESITVTPEADTRYVLYSAFKKEEIEQIEEMTKRISLNLVAIDASYSAMLRGLSASGMVEDDIENATLWSILLINTNNVATISLMGDKVIDIVEEPIAIKSLSAEDVYPTVVSYSLESLKSKSPEHVVVISETDEVSAEILSSYFDLNCKISFIEENKFCKNALFVTEDEVLTDLPLKPDLISLEAVGAGCWKKSEIAINFNFVSSSGMNGEGVEVNILGKKVVLTATSLNYLVLGWTVLSFVTIAILYMIISSFTGALDTKLTDLNTQVTNLNTQIAAIQQPAQTAPGASPQEVLNTVYANNGKFLQAYNTVGGVIPEKLWIDSLEIHKDMTASISGKASSVEDVIAYYQNLLRICKFQNFKITGIKVVNDQAPNQAQSAPSNGLPGLPQLTPAGSSEPQKYYQFTFGPGSGSPMPAAPAPAAPAPSAPTPMGPTR